MSYSNPATLRQIVNQSGATLLPNLLLDAYHFLGMTNDEVLIVMHLMRCQDSATGSDLQLSDYLMEKMKRSRSEIGYLLRGLQSKGLLLLNQDPGKTSPQDISLHFVYSSLLNWSELPEEKKLAKADTPYTEMVRVFERAFRHLSEFEYERIKEWLAEDNWPPEVIREALRIAALHRALSFKYIDRILLNWQMEGYRTLTEIEQANEERELRKRQADSATEPATAGDTRSFSRSRRRTRPAFKVGSINRQEESPEERRKRFDKLVE